MTPPVAARRRTTFIILLAGLLLLGGAVFLALLQWAQRPRVEPLAWNLTLTGRDGRQVVLSYTELKSLPVVETRGGFFSSVGVVYGPYTLKGIRLATLLDLVGGMTASDVLMVAAKDGYSSVFDYKQITGEIDTFEPGSLHLVPQGPVEFLLVFEQDGRPLADEEGKPLRLAVTNPDGLLTEGHWWVKWVDHLEVRPLPPTSTPAP